MWLERKTEEELGALNFQDFMSCANRLLQRAGAEDLPSGRKKLSIHSTTRYNRPDLMLDAIHDPLQALTKCPPHLLHTVPKYYLSLCPPPLATQRGAVVPVQSLHLLSNIHMATGQGKYIFANTIRLQPRARNTDADT